MCFNIIIVNIVFCKNFKKRLNKNLIFQLLDIYDKTFFAFKAMSLKIQKKMQFVFEIFKIRVLVIL